MNIFKLLLFTILTGSLTAGSPSTPFAYALTPQGVGSHRLMIMVPDLHAHEKITSDILFSDKGSGKCFEVQDDGTLKELWSVSWFAPREYLYFHQDGRSLLRLHPIKANLKPSKNNYADRPAISFYRDGKLLKTVQIGKIIKNYKSFSGVSWKFELIREVKSSQFSMKEMGYVIYDETLKNKLKNESIFCVTSLENDKLYFTYSGVLINRVAPQLGK